MSLVCEDPMLVRVNFEWTSPTNFFYGKYIFILVC